MKKLILAALAATTALSAASTADAAQGCGRGFHRAAYGRCIPNRGFGYAPRGPAMVYSIPVEAIGTAAGIGVIAIAGMAAGGIAEPTAGRGLAAPPVPSEPIRSRQRAPIVGDEQRVDELAGIPDRA